MKGTSRKVITSKRKSKRRIGGGIGQILSVSESGELYHPASEYLIMPPNSF
jgi:hypothetical protein